MPARPKGPWFRKGRGYYAFIDGVSHNLRTKDRAAAWEAFYRLMGEAGIQAEPDQTAKVPISVRELLERFGDWAERHRKPMTAAFYDQFIAGFLKHFTAAGATPAPELRPYHVQQWIDSRARWNSTTQNRAAAAVKRAYSWGVEQGLIDADPIRPLRKAKPRRRLRILTDDEWAKLLAACPNGALRAFLELQRATGARPQELRAAEIRHYDRAGKCLRFPADESKGGIARVIVLTEAADVLVRRSIGARDEGSILVNTDGYPWTRSGLRMGMRRLAESTGVKFDAFTARHTYATDALTNGVDGLTVGVLMGHVDPSMVGRIYSHLDQKPDYLRGAAEKAVKRNTAGACKDAPARGSAPTKGKRPAKSAPKAKRPKRSA